MIKIKTLTLIFLAMLSGCAGMPICPEIKLAMCPAQAEK